MLRCTSRLAEHLQSSAQFNSPVYHERRKSQFWARRRHNFAKRGLMGKMFTLFGYGAAGIGLYTATCLVVRTAHQPTVDALFAPGKDMTLDEWRDVEPTLQPGDIILMRGSGLMSWTIATLQFMFSWMHPAALRYSHVAVVVAPPIVEYVTEEEYAKARASLPPYTVEKLEDVFATNGQDSVGTPQQTAKSVVATPSSAQQKSVHAQLQAEEAALRRRRPLVRRSAIILEAMDNKDYHIPDVTGQVTYDSVQVVEASRRIFSKTPTQEPAYCYFAVRRLENYKRTPETQERVKQFCLDSVGRRMDGSLLYPLAFLFPSLHTITHPKRESISGELSCSELIVELYQYLGIVQRHWRWVPVPNTTGSTTTADTADQEAPLPTLADLAHNRSAGSLHVYDYLYGRVRERAEKPMTTRERPALPEASIIENGENLASLELRVRSSMAPLKPEWPEVEKIKELADLFGHTLTGQEAEAARQKLRTRTTATYTRDAEVPSPALRAGDVASGSDNKQYQLQWYYKHNSVATCPYHFTEGLGESVLDFAMNVGLGPELYMRIDRPDDSTQWIIDDE